MANSITPAGTSRSIFGVSTGDIETGGSITAATFIGVGKNITNIVATNITTGTLGVARGGTGSYSYINNALVFNSNNQLISDNNLVWKNGVLTINNRDFIKDTSNYITSESSKLANVITTADTLLTQRITADIADANHNISNYILTTSNVLVEYIRTEQENNVVNPATTNTLGGVQIGDGIYVNDAGVISLTPEIINVTTPAIYNPPPTMSFIDVPNSYYKVCKFTYNSAIGTVFDRGNPTNRILPVWYKFSLLPENILISTVVGSANYGITRIKNSGFLGYPTNPLANLTNIELHGDAVIKPINSLRNTEYTPLDTTYLEFNCTGTGAGGAGAAIPAFGKIERGFDINSASVFKANSNWAITISFWLKVNKYSEEIIITEFSNNDPGDLHKLNINYVDNTLTFYIDKSRQVVMAIPMIYTGRWYHVSWSIEKRTTDFEVIVHINGARRESLAYTNDFLLIIGFSNFTKNTISSAANISTYNFCVADFKIYNYPLTDDEKYELYDMNSYTKYMIDFKDSRTFCDIIAYGGGGGGNSNYGGGAGRLVYANDAYIAGGLKTIKVGRGGSGYYYKETVAYTTSNVIVSSNISITSNITSNIDISYGISPIITSNIIASITSNITSNIPISYVTSSVTSNLQLASRGYDTIFESLTASGGGAVFNNIFTYIRTSNIFISSNYSFVFPETPDVIRFANFSSNYNVYSVHTSNMSSNIIGGCGSGNNGITNNFSVTGGLRTFLGNTNNIYGFANVGGEYGGGGVGAPGARLNGGSGLYGLNINNLNMDTDTYFNFRGDVNFKRDFNIIESEIGELYNGNVYIACGGAGSSNIGDEKGVASYGYSASASSSGCGGRYGENGKHGGLLLRFLTVIDRKVVPSFVRETSNYVESSSNSLIAFVNNITSMSGGLLWAKATSNIYYNTGNVGIGVEPNNYKLEVAAGDGITLDDTLNYGILTSNDSNIQLTSNITNTDICAKFNSSIWTSGNVISSSDERIKKNICDLEDDTALQMILNIKPKKYQYIDTIGRGRGGGSSANNEGNEVYGFIAQQIHEVIPDAVKIHTEFIPNIFAMADYDPEERVITLPSVYQAVACPYINADTKRIKCYDMRNNTIIADILEILDGGASGACALKVAINGGYRYNKIFVYGTEVSDFHALNKEYINTLNVCAVQELHRKIAKQSGEIAELKEQINVLVNYVDMSKIETVQNEVTELKTRFDMLIRSVDLSNTK